MEEACLPDASAETDEDGTAVLDALRPGLYLLSGQSVCVNRQIYTPSPMLIVCPAECAAEPELTRSPEKADYSVQIVWDDEKTPEQRPGSLPVQLMCDGKAYGRPVLLSEEQDWHYTWSSLPTAHYWALAEQVVPGYLDAEVQKEGTGRSAAGTEASARGRGSAGNRKARLACSTCAHTDRRSGDIPAESTKKIKKSLTVNLLDTVR